MTITPQLTSNGTPPAAASRPDPVMALLSTEVIFGSELAGNEELVAAIRSAHRNLTAKGATDAVMAYIGEPA